MKAKRIEALKLPYDNKDSSSVADLGLSYDAQGRIVKVH